MANRINWTRYITDEAIYRFWYILENNNFKHAIKNAQKDAKMNYAAMHNALYTGLYFPNKPFNYDYRAINDLRNMKNITGAVANYMGREEILRNIHAMSQCADFIRANATYGYNARLFAKEFYNIGLNTTKIEKKKKINPKLVVTSTPSKDELTPNVPQRYRLAKTLQKNLRAKGNTLIFIFYTSETKKAKYKKEHFNYIKAKAKFENLLKKYGFDDANSIKKLTQALNSGFYKTVIPFYGFEIDEVLRENSISGIVKIQEFQGNAFKFELACKHLKGIKSSSFSDLMKKLQKSGEISRNHFIKKEHNYPECYTGFLQTFCRMLEKVYVFDNNQLNISSENDLNKVAKNLIETMQKINMQYKTATTPEEKKEAEQQIKKIQEALDKSNTNNI